MDYWLATAYFEVLLLFWDLKKLFLFRILFNFRDASASAFTRRPRQCLKRIAFRLRWKRIIAQTRQWKATALRRKGKLLPNETWRPFFGENLEVFFFNSAWNMKLCAEEMEFNCWFSCQETA